MATLKNIFNFFCVLILKDLPDTANGQNDGLTAVDKSFRINKMEWSAGLPPVKPKIENQSHASRGSKIENQQAASKKKLASNMDSM